MKLLNWLKNLFKKPEAASSEDFVKELLMETSPSEPQPMKQPEISPKSSKGRKSKKKPAKRGRGIN